MSKQRREFMKHLSIYSLVAALAASLTLCQAEPLKVGDGAPNFELKGSDGKTYKLSDFKGKKPVVIAWFPKAFTPGCTKECKAMAEQGDQIRKYDVAYFTASVDDPETNAKFAKSVDADYPILSDPSKGTAKAFGVLNERGMANRVTFYIDKNGKIAAVDQKVNTEQHGKDVAAKLKDLGVSEKKS
jgi:peroxiredoxin Q/BCP